MFFFLIQTYQFMKRQKELIMQKILKQDLWNV